MTVARTFLIAAVMLAVGAGRADARPAAHGWYAEVDLGAAGALGDAAT